jgi:hypothetical protein
LVVACALASAGAASADAAAVEVSPVGFVLTSETCPNLAEGTTITGSGSAKSISHTRTDANGITTVTNTTHAFGTAVDQDGNSYVFNYSNSFRVANTGPTDAVFTGTMTDSFSLAGRGPERLHNGFVAGFTTDFGQLFGFEEQSSRGDPIDFATGAPICDPL